MERFKTYQKFTMPKEVFSVDYENEKFSFDTAMDGYTKNMIRQYCDTKDQLVREALISFGWTPPAEVVEEMATTWNERHGSELVALKWDDLSVFQCEKLTDIRSKIAEYMDITPDSEPSLICGIEMLILLETCSDFRKLGHGIGSIEIACCEMILTLDLGLYKTTLKSTKNEVILVR